MRMTLCLLAISTVLSASALAQQPAQPPAVAGPGNEAISTTQDPNSAGPVKGANSFTEDQARSRIEAYGFTNVSRLTKDPDGIWRGMAMLQGQNVAVALDFKGDVFPRR